MASSVRRRPGRHCGRRVELFAEDEGGAAEAEHEHDRPQQQAAPQMRARREPAHGRPYWITECGVATMRCTLICSRSISPPTLGLISFFQ
jgi:hypothetical protein